MSEMSDFDEWVLKTAKNIDEMLVEYANNYNDHRNVNDPLYEKYHSLFETQRLRIELVKAVMGY